MNIVDLPDDCLLSFTPWMSILDIICLRMTCRRMSSMTRTRFVWRAIYERLLKRLPMPALHHPYTSQTAPYSVLEKYCVFAYRLYRRWSGENLMPVRTYELQLLMTENGDQVDRSQSQQLHLLPGGQWLVDARVNWETIIWDLERRSQHQVIDDFTKLVSFDQAQTMRMSSCHPTWTNQGSEMAVLFHGICDAKQFGMQPESFFFIWTVDTLQQQEKSGYEVADLERSYQHQLLISPMGLRFGMRALPPVPISHGNCSQLDVNGNLVSFHVSGEDEIHIYDWTYSSPTNTRHSAMKGIVLELPPMQDIIPFFSVEVWTRLLHTGDRTYVMMITAMGHVTMFEVPPLEIASSSHLPRSRAVPIAQTSLPAIPYVPGRWDHSADTSLYNISLFAGRIRCTMSFSPPSPSSKSSSHSLSCFMETLPVSFTSDVCLSVIGPSGCRGIYQEQDIPSPYPTLNIFAGSLRSPACSQEDLDTDSMVIQDPKRLSRPILPVEVMEKKMVDMCVFDENTGRVCYRWFDSQATDGFGTATAERAFTLCVMDFSPLPLESLSMD